MVGEDKRNDFRRVGFFRIETGQYLRSDMPSYTDPLVFYGENSVDPMQATYPHLQQGKELMKTKIFISNIFVS